MRWPALCALLVGCAVPQGACVDYEPQAYVQTIPMRGAGYVHRDATIIVCRERFPAQ